MFFFQEAGVYKLYADSWMLQGIGTLYDALLSARTPIFLAVFGTDTVMSIWPSCTRAAAPMGLPKLFFIPVLIRSAPAPDARGFSLRT